MPKPELAHVNTSLVAEPVLAKNPDGRLQLIEVNAGGELKVAVSGAGSGGTSMVDDAAFSPGTSGVTPAAGYYLVARDTLNDGDAGAVAVTQKRALLACLETPTGDSVMDDTNDAVRVNLVAGAGSGGTASNFGDAVPSAGTAAGFSDGTNMQAARTFDADSGAGTENVLGVVLRKIASGGSVELGTLADPIRVDPTGTTAQDVDVLSLPALPAGTNNIGDVDVLTLPAIPAGTNTIGSVGVVPSTSGGCDTYHLVSAGSTNATVVKASAGQLYGWYIYNSNAAARKVAFHNTASTPTAGASVFFSIMIPPASAANVLGANGIAFSTGIGITTVTEVADNGTTAVGENDLIINLFYK